MRFSGRTYGLTPFSQHVLIYAPRYPASLAGSRFMFKRRQTMVGLVRPTVNDGPRLTSTKRLIESSKRDSLAVRKRTTRRVRPLTVTNGERSCSNQPRPLNAPSICFWRRSSFPQREILTDREVGPLRMATWEWSPKRIASTPPWESERNSWTFWTVFGIRALHRL